ncbi:hypothetical protein KAS79_00360 [Candidatus Parcubacteria bacterium]|nr:hypothetical protein [Candidatus Parcubacteria bacterium]
MKEKMKTMIVAILIIVTIGIVGADVWDAYYSHVVYIEEIEVHIAENINVELLSGADSAFVYPGNILCRTYKITNKKGVEQKMMVNFGISEVPYSLYTVIEGTTGPNEFYVPPGEKIVQACWKPLANAPSGDYTMNIVFSRMKHTFRG